MRTACRRSLAPLILPPRVGGVLALNAGASSDSRNITMAYSLRRTKNAKLVRSELDLDRLNGKARRKREGSWRVLTVPTTTVGATIVAA